MPKEVLPLSVRVRESRQARQRIEARTNQKYEDALQKRRVKTANKIAKRVVKAALKGKTQVDVSRRAIGMFHDPIERPVFDIVNHSLAPEGIQVIPGMRTYTVAPFSGYLFMNAASYVDKHKEIVTIQLVPPQTETAIPAMPDPRPSA
jgi:hypothetical protein